MNRLTRHILLLTLCLLPVSSFADTLQLTTYYPAPYGAYDRLRLVPRAVLPNNPDCTAANAGTFYVSVVGDLYMCQLDGTWGPAPGIWKKAANNIWLKDSETTPALKVGIGTTTPEFKLTLAQDGGILAKGDTPLGTGANLTTAGAGIRMLWYPQKAAFRAGEVGTTEWDDAFIANHSAAFGANNTASGLASFVTGSGNTTNDATEAPAGTYSAIVGGSSNRNSVPNSFIGGGESNSIVSGSHSVILGGNTNSIGGVGSLVESGAIIASENTNVIGLDGTAFIANSSRITFDNQTTLTVPNTAISYEGSPTMVLGTYNLLLSGRDGTITGSDNAIISSYSPTITGSNTTILNSNDVTVATGTKNAIIHSATATITNGDQNTLINSPTATITDGDQNAIFNSSTPTITTGSRSTVITSDTAIISGSKNAAFNSDTATLSGTANAVFNSDTATITGDPASTLNNNAFFNSTSSSIIANNDSTNINNTIINSTGVTLTGVDVFDSTYNNTVINSSNVGVTGFNNVLFAQNVGLTGSNNFVWGSSDPGFPVAINGSNNFIIFPDPAIAPGSVGIGVPNPTQTLDVNGTAQATSVIVTNNDGLILSDGVNSGPLKVNCSTGDGNCYAVYAP